MSDEDLRETLGYLKARVEDHSVQLSRIDMNVDLLLQQSHERRGAVKLLAFFAGFVGALVSWVLTLLVRRIG